MAVDRLQLHAYDCQILSELIVELARDSLSISVPLMQGMADDFRKHSLQPRNLARQKIDIEVFALRTSIFAVCEDGGGAR